MSSYNYRQLALRTEMCTFLAMAYMYENSIVKPILYITKHQIRK